MGALTQQLRWMSMGGCLEEVAFKSLGSGYPTGTGSGENLRSPRIRVRLLK